MTDLEHGLLEKLRREIDLRNSYAICDRTTRPTYAAYVARKAEVRQGIRQSISDLRWTRSERSGLAPVLKEGA